MLLQMMENEKIRGAAILITDPGCVVQISTSIDEFRLGLE